MPILKTYDDILLEQLRKRLGREPLENELTNADNDSDLVNEVLWQLVCNLANRMVILEKKAKVTPITTVTPDAT